MIYLECTARGFLDDQEKSVDFSIFFQNNEGKIIKKLQKDKIIDSRFLLYIETENKLFFIILK